MENTIEMRLNPAPATCVRCNWWLYPNLLYPHSEEFYCSEECLKKHEQGEPYIDHMIVS